MIFRNIKLELLKLNNIFKILKKYKTGYKFYYTYNINYVFILSKIKY